MLRKVVRVENFSFLRNITKVASTNSTTSTSSTSTNATTAKGPTSTNATTAKGTTSTNTTTTQKFENASTTIDNIEISHFKNYSEGWWNENGKMKPLHSMNNLRVPFVRDGLINSGRVHKDMIHSPQPLANLEILDVGCGGGVLTESLARLGAKVTGLDACKELVDCAALHAKENPEISQNISYVYQTIEDHCFGNNVGKYDAVVASEIVEHVSSQKLFIKSCCEVLKPGGSIFITTMNKTYLSWLLGIVAAENVLGIVPQGTHDWDKFIAPHEIQRLLEDHNCRTKCVHGMFYNFLLNQWYWFPDNSVNYALHAVKNQ